MDSNTKHAGDPAQLQRTDSNVSSSSDGMDVEVVESDPTGRYSRFSEVLGSGACKTVYKGFDDEEGTEVAWNQIRVVQLLNGKADRDRMFAEIRVLKQLKHKNIMTFHDSWLDNKNYCINFITELFTSGTLRQYRRRHRHIDDDVMKRWAWQILCGLVYLHGHSPPIIHRDLKCDNIFINGSSGIVKIGDLGLATLLKARTAPQTVTGTPEFMAPELYEEEYDDRVDVYSFGMCLLELATMEYPYSECTSAPQIYRKVTLGIRPQCLAKVPNRELAEFIELCIRPRNERPRSRHLLKHHYFSSIRKKCTKPHAELLSTATSQYDMHSSASSGEGSHAASVDGDHAHHTVTAPPPSVVSSSVPPSPMHLTAATSRTFTPEALSPASAHTPHGHESGSRPMTAGMNIQGPYHGSQRASSGAADLNADSNQSINPGSLQSAVDSLHTIADHLPGLLDGRSESPAYFNQDGTRRASLRPISSEQEMANSLAYPDREFRVRGKLIPSEQHSDDSEKLNLKLRIIEPEGPAKTVQFHFDLGTDTAMSVASEMVDDLCLSAEDARSIAAAIKQEIKLLGGLMPRDPNSSSSSDDGVDQIDIDEEPPLEHSPSETQHQERAPQHDAGQPDRQQQQPMPPEPGDGIVVRVSSFGKPRPGWEQQQHQQEASPPVQRTRSSEVANMEAAMALAATATRYDNRGSQPAAAVAADHLQDGSMYSAATPAPQRFGSCAPHQQLPVQASYVGGANAHRGIYEGQGQSRQLPSGTPVSPVRSIAASSEDGYAGSAMSVDVSTGSVVAGRDHLRLGAAAHPAQLQGAHGHLDTAQSDFDMLPRGLAHSSSTQTLKGGYSMDLSSQLAGAVAGVKRSGSGVLSPPRVADRDRKVPLHQLFTDAGHIPRLQPMAHPLRITDLAVAPASSIVAGRPDRTSDVGASGMHSRSSTADSLPIVSLARRTATAPAIPSVASVIRLPPYPVKSNPLGAAIKPAVKQPAVQAFAPFSPRVGTSPHPALPRRGSYSGGGGGFFPAAAGDASVATHYGARCTSDGPLRPPGYTGSVHSMLSTHSDGGVYSRRSLLDSATSLPSMPGVGY